MAATGQAFVLTARAKLNVRLEVGRVRPDGMHDVRSVVADLCAGDTVTFEPGTGAFSLTCDDPSIPAQTNIALRAAHALGLALPPVRVHIEKTLPVQAGLGGGSADAAAVLRGIAAIVARSGVALPSSTILAAAVTAGSDVPACLTPGLKIVGGAGETVRALPGGALPWGVVLLKPRAGMPTSAAYRLLDEARASGNAPAPNGDGRMDALCEALKSADFARACALAHNDFQSVVEAALPEVARARGRLIAAGASVAILCGSGSCVAGLFESIAAANAALAVVERRAGEWAAATGFAHDG